MSTYFYACCHDCKVYTELYNTDLEKSEALTERWSKQFKHSNHSVQTFSEYVDGQLEEIISGRTEYANVTEEAHAYFESG